MTWNWQQQDWPQFRYDESRLKSYEALYLKGSGQIWGAMRHLTQDDKSALSVDLLSLEAVKTSEIEGEYLW